MIDAILTVTVLPFFQPARAHETKSKSSPKRKCEPAGGGPGGGECRVVLGRVQSGVGEKGVRVEF